MYEIAVLLVVCRTGPHSHTLHSELLCGKAQSCCSVSTITDLFHHWREICSASCPSVAKVQVQALGRVIISPSRRQTGVGIICLQPLVLSCVGVIQGLWREMELDLRSLFLGLSSSLFICFTLLCLSVLYQFCFQFELKGPSFSLHLSLFLFDLFILSLLFCVKRGGNI